MKAEDLDIKDMRSWICGRCNLRAVLPPNSKGHECPRCKENGVKHPYLHCTDSPTWRDEA